MLGGSFDNGIEGQHGSPASKLEKAVVEFCCVIFLERRLAYNVIGILKHFDQRWDSGLSCEISGPLGGGREGHYKRRRERCIGREPKGVGQVYGDEKQCENDGEGEAIGGVLVGLWGYGIMR